VTREEFEAQDRQLVEAIAAARETARSARETWDRLCEERVRLHEDWRDQNQEAAP
jgi:hypothetical protein